MKLAHKSNLHSGFTLIELLTSIAIIAILAGILVPTLGRARERAKSVHCKNNLRQLGIAARLYADSNGERYPRIVEPSANNGMPNLNRQLRLTLIDFASDPQIFGCLTDGSDILAEGGTSYRWHSTWNYKLVDSQRSQTDSPLISDSAPRHGRPPAVNAVFTDGHVGRFFPDRGE